MKVAFVVLALALSACTKETPVCPDTVDMSALAQDLKVLTNQKPVDFNAIYPVLVKYGLKN